MSDPTAIIVGIEAYDARRGIKFDVTPDSDPLRNASEVLFDEPVARSLTGRERDCRREVRRTLFAMACEDALSGIMRRGRRRELVRYGIELGLDQIDAAVVVECAIQHAAAVRPHSTTDEPEAGLAWHDWLAAGAVAITSILAAALHLL